MMVGWHRNNTMIMEELIPQILRDGIKYPEPIGHGRNGLTLFQCNRRTLAARSMAEKHDERVVETDA